MKRHLFTPTILFICILTISAQISQAQQSPEDMEFDATISLQFDDPTLALSAESQDVKVQTESGTYPATFDANLVIETDTGDASGHIRVQNSGTGKTFAAEVIAANAHVNAHGLVTQITVRLQNCDDGSSATAVFSSVDGSGIPSHSIVPIRVKIKHEI